MRNLVNQKIRKETITHNENRVKNANNEGEIWKIVTEVIKPKKENEWTIQKENGLPTSDHQEVADIFNVFFIKKVEDLKANIDKDFVMDPIGKLNLQNKSGSRFSIKK